MRSGPNVKSTFDDMVSGLADDTFLQGPLPRPKHASKRTEMQPTQHDLCSLRSSTQATLKTAPLAMPRRHDSAARYFVNNLPDDAPTSAQVQAMHNEFYDALKAVVSQVAGGSNAGVYVGT